jgi:hypothetical protein
VWALTKFPHWEPTGTVTSSTAYNFNQRTELIPYSERIGYFGNFEYDISKNVSVFAEGFSRMSGHKEIAAPDAGGYRRRDLRSAVNPYNPFGTRLLPLFRLVEGGDVAYLHEIRDRAIHRRVQDQRFAEQTGRAEFAGNFERKQSDQPRRELLLDSTRPRGSFQDGPRQGAATLFLADGEGFNSPQVIDGMRVSPIPSRSLEQRLVDFRASGDLPLSTPAGPDRRWFSVLNIAKRKLSVTPDPRSLPTRSTGFGDIIGPVVPARMDNGLRRVSIYQVDVPIAGPNLEYHGGLGAELEFRRPV